VASTARTCDGHIIPDYPDYSGINSTPGSTTKLETRRGITSCLRVRVFAVNRDSSIPIDESISNCQSSARHEFVSINRQSKFDARARTRARLSRARGSLEGEVLSIAFYQVCEDRETDEKETRKRESGVRFSLNFR